MGKTGNDAYLKLLCDDNDNGLESFVFDENALSSGNDNDVHDALHDTLDVDDVNDNDGLCDDNDGLCDLNDIEFMPAKTRSKERAKKTKHDRAGSSSGARQGVSDLVAPGGRGLPHLNAKQRERVEELQEKGVLRGFYFDYALLDAYGCREEVERMVSRQYWERFFSWRDDTYEPGGRFTGVKQNTSKIVSPALKMMKLLLNLTFGGRNKNLHKVYRFDLFHLWSLEMNEPIPMACMVQQMFHSQKNAKCPYVWIGPVVTRLCHGLGLQGELAREKMIATMQPFSDAHLSRSYARRVGDVPRPPRGEPQQEPVVEGGQNVPPEYADYPPVHDWASMRALQIQLHTHSMDTFNRRIDLQHEEMMRHNEAILRHNEAIVRQNEAIERQHEATEMMVPRDTLERGETSRGNHDDSSSEEGEGYNMEYANRGLMLQVEDLFRFRHFRAKEIIEWCYVDTPTLEALGIRREYERIATQPFWRAICSWRDATYTPIVREFVATLEVNEEIRDRRLPSIKFKLFNKEYDISSDALGNLLGFYTLADQGQAWYANLVEDFESELQEDLFWWSIARPGVTWRASYTSARYIKVPELLILWHIVARSWLGRKTLNDNITRSELFILWSMYTETPVHMGELCKRILKRQSYEDSENVFIGPFVSRLAEALGFEEVLSQEVVTTTMRPIDMEECVHLGLRFNDTMEETRERELWDTIRRLENRVDVLELVVQRLILDSHGEEPFELREWSSAPR
nr:hypothetical protein L195_g018629 [Ipomoea batatas]